jgi:GcrA cell cycle regulator
MGIQVFEWTPESIDRAAELWNDGNSASQVASHFGVSRSAISGIAHRHRDLFTRKGSGFRSDAVKREKPKRERKVKPNRNSGFFHPRAKIEPEIEPVPVLTKADAAAYDAERRPLAKPLHELASCECHWPLNNGAPFLFCSAEAAGTYCDHHQQRSTQKSVHTTE